jgi:hypothetical protein
MVRRHSQRLGRRAGHRSGECPSPGPSTYTSIQNGDGESLICQWQCQQRRWLACEKDGGAILSINFPDTLLTLLLLDSPRPWHVRAGRRLVWRGFLCLSGMNSLSRSDFSLISTTHLALYQEAGCVPIKNRGPCSLYDVYLVSSDTDRQPYLQADNIGTIHESRPSPLSGLWGF